jgi:hypothetical protein
MIIYSVQYKGYHIPPSPTPATGKEPVLWHHISAVSAILDLEQLGASFLVCRSIWIFNGLSHEMDMKAYRIKSLCALLGFTICQ